MKQPKRNTKRSVTNAFGALGYFFGFLQVFWAVMLYFSVIQSTTLFIAPDADQPVEHASSFALRTPGPVELIIMGIVVIIMIGVTIYALVKIPMSIAKAGNKLIHKTTDTVVPIVVRTQHQQDTKKTRARITWKIVLAIKLLLVIVPLAFTAASGLLEKQSIDYAIAMTLGVWLASFSITFFAVQYLLAWLLRIKLAAVR